MANKKDYDFLFKLVLIGDTGVGKSCLLLRFCDNTFTENFISTIGVDFRFRTLKVEKKNIKLQIWDTAGQERYRTITSAYYRGADGIIMVYDVTSEESFNHINDWFLEVNRYASENTCKLIVGNKIDLPNRVVTTEKAQAYAEKLNIPYIETSAMDSTNVESAFEEIAKQLVAIKGESSKSKSTADKGTIKNLNNGGSDNAEKKKKCC